MKPVPKETIGNKGPFSAHVGWAAGGGVQLGIRVQTSDNLTLTLSSQPGPDEHDSVWSDLDRHDINRLIRLLRKARDQAYGADA